jgi:hypothetical protein
MAEFLSKFVFRPINLARDWLVRRGKAMRGPRLQKGLAPLPPQVADDLDRGRAWVRGCFPADARPHFETIAGRLAFLQIMLKQGLIKPDEILKQQSLGIVFGDAVAEQTGMIWVMKADRHGEEPALNLPGTSLSIFPLSMVAKRMTADETIDMSELFIAICSEVDRIKRLPNLG